VDTSESGKRAINLSMSNHLLEAAKNLEINISPVCDSHLREFVRREQEHKWREDHADCIAAYNNTIDAEGLTLYEWGKFLMARFRQPRRRPYLLETPKMGSVPQRVLKSPVISLAQDQDQDQITVALDFLFQGY